MTMHPVLMSGLWQDRRRDCRRKAEELAAALQQQAWLFSPAQKALLEMILDKGSSLEQIARLTGQNASTLSRQFDRLMRRLTDPLIRDVLRLGDKLSPLEAAILRDYFLCGMSQKAVIGKLGCSRYRLRKTLDRIRRPAAGKPKILKTA
ncbi:MAG TPA: hypothetical protein P5175_09795 [Anaerohalosphaeraceae bacterium]|nr:sigma-70 family RNA polymerase sigma factor [Phycisphaerae bacterium]HOK96157.1 hypothetical protein [Anaerohalosphaeraceae bacterium]HOL90106.1 hypothetical protein [Anaerohalosphaeraceae bacterium]HOM77413.1 hypothetical protein [Anaerohalosphaeraceae bacterium]HPC64016.1 hypothetical protein [Anaerohalosphaeraceae bacterium]